jgi:hypothetical protein
MDKNQRSVEVIRPSFDTRVNPMSEETAPIQEDMSLGIKKSDFVARRR